MNCKLKVRN